jgi:hypothetical protein
MLRTFTRRGNGASAGSHPPRTIMDLPTEVPAASSFRWRRLVLEWLAFGAGALALAVALHALYTTLGVYA